MWLKNIKVFCTSLPSAKIPFPFVVPLICISIICSLLPFLYTKHSTIPAAALTTFSSPLNYSLESTFAWKASSHMLSDSWLSCTRNENEDLSDGALFNAHLFCSCMCGIRASRVESRKHNPFLTGCSSPASCSQGAPWWYRWALETKQKKPHTHSLSGGESGWVTQGELVSDCVCVRVCFWEMVKERENVKTHPGLGLWVMGAESNFKHNSTS